MKMENKDDLYKRSARNASWNTIDYFVMPVLLLATTPFLVHRLGIEQYGIWMLVNSLAGMMGIVNPCFGDAAIKFVAHYRARNEIAGALRIARTVFTIYVFWASITFAIIYLAAPFLINYVFKVDVGMRAIAVTAIRLGGAAFALRFFESVCSSTLRGFERYDFASAANIFTKVSVIGSAVFLVGFGYGVIEILVAILVITNISILIQGYLAQRLLNGVFYKPIFDIGSLKEVSGFGFWRWLQEMTSAVFLQSDRFLISAILGTGMLTYYAVCLQIAQQAYRLLSATASFIFPVASALNSGGETGKLQKLYSQSTTLIAISAVVIIAPLYFLASPILTVLMGGDFAHIAAPTLKLLILAYGAYSLTIIPSSFLNGIGLVKINVFFGAISAIIVVAASIILLPRIGIMGAGWAHIVNIITVIGLMYKTRTLIFYGAKKETLAA